MVSTSRNSHIELESYRFEHSKKCPHNRQCLPRVDEANAQAQSPPGECNTRKPDGGTDLPDKHVAGKLEKDVSDEEDLRSSQEMAQHEDEC